MPEYRRGHDHARVIPTTEHLDIRAAGERHLNFDQNVTTTDMRNGYRLHLQVLLAVKHSSHHVVIHYDHLCG